MKRVAILASFFSLTPIVIITAIISYGYLGYSKTDKLLFPLIGKTQVTKPLSYAALPTAADVIQPTITTQDSRIEAIQNFLAAYHSPMLPYAQNFVTEADQNHFDPRLLVAIAMQESTLGKSMPHGEYNAFGWGIFNGKEKGFTDFAEAIHVVSQGLGKYYISKGLTTPETIGPVWNPNNTNNWTGNVSSIMNQI